MSINKVQILPGQESKLNVFNISYFATNKQSRIYFPVNSPGNRDITALHCISEMGKDKGKGGGGGGAKGGDKGGKDKGGKDEKKGGKENGRGLQFCQRPPHFV